MKKMENETLKNVLPASLNLKILSFLQPSLQREALGFTEENKLPKVTFLDKLKEGEEPKLLNKDDLKALEEKGFVLKDKFLDNQELLYGLTEEVTIELLFELFSTCIHLNNDFIKLKILKMEQMKPAGMSRGDSKWKDDKIRGDLHLWVHDTESFKPFKFLVCLLHSIDSIRNELNEKCEFGSEKVQIQVTCYPGEEARYVRHLDTLKDKGPDRRVTCIYYPNREWKKEDGGELRVYLENGEDFVDIQPVADRLVVFQSRRIEHEVLPTKKERYAVSSWFY